MTTNQSLNSLASLQALVVGNQAYTYYSLAAAEQTLGDLSHLPGCMRVLLENLLRHEDDKTVTIDDMRALSAFHALQKNVPTISFRPSRLLINDAAGVSVLTDMAAFNDALIERNIEPSAAIPSCVNDIVIESPFPPTSDEVKRLSLLKWGEKIFPGLRLIPPNKGATPHINLDSRGSVVQIAHEDDNTMPIVIPDTVLGTDPHFTTINGLSLLGWQTDGLEIESLMLGQALHIHLPGVIGAKVTGKIHKGTTITDIALTISSMLADNKCEGKIVEFLGPSLENLSVPDRAVIAAYAAQAGALCCFFPIDAATLSHLTVTGHTPAHIALVEAYAKAQGLWRVDAPSGHEAKHGPAFTHQIDIPLEMIRPALGGPNKSCSFTPLANVAAQFDQTFSVSADIYDPLAPVKQGDVIIASICSALASIHPTEMVMAGLIANKANARGLKVRPWVRASLALQNPALAAFMEATGLARGLNAIGFANTNPSDTSPPPIQDAIQKAIAKNRLAVAAVISGGNLSGEMLPPLCRATYASSPAYAVLYALAGSMAVDILTKPLGTDQDGKFVQIKDLWPSSAEIHAVFETTPMAPFYTSQREHLFDGPPEWTSIPTPLSKHFPWDESSRTLRKPPVLASFTDQAQHPSNIRDGRVLAIFGDNVRAIDLAPTGPIPQNAPAGYYLTAHNQAVETFQTFELKSGNHEVMVRGAFMGATLVNALLGDQAHSSGITLHLPTNTILPYFDAAERYKRENTPLILIAGKHFGAGTGQEWAAKVIHLLGIRLVIAESYDPAFRLNLIRVGVLPLRLKTGMSCADMKLSGHEIFHFAGIGEVDRPLCDIMTTIDRADEVDRYMVICDVQNLQEMDYLREGSLLSAVLRKSLAVDTVS